MAHSKPHNCTRRRPGEEATVQPRSDLWGPQASEDCPIVHRFSDKYTGRCCDRNMVRDDETAQTQTHSEPQGHEQRHNALLEMVVITSPIQQTHDEVFERSVEPVQFHQACCGCCSPATHHSSIPSTPLQSPTHAQFQGRAPPFALFQIKLLPRSICGPHGRSGSASSSVFVRSAIMARLINPSFLCLLFLPSYSPFPRLFPPQFLTTVSDDTQDSGVCARLHACPIPRRLSVNTRAFGLRAQVRDCDWLLLHGEPVLPPASGSLRQEPAAKLPSPITARCLWQARRGGAALAGATNMRPTAQRSIHSTHALSLPRLSPNHRFSAPSATS